MVALFVTDIHGRADRVAALPTADLLIAGGDITHFGTSRDAMLILERAASRFPRILAVPGNCDAPDTVRILDARGWGLHLTPVVVGRVLFFGIGGSNPTPAFTPGEWDESGMEEEMGPVIEQALAEPAPYRILVSHAPPRGSGADRLPRGPHVGSLAVAAAAVRLNADMILCGHIHEAQGIFSWEGRTVVNPGPLRDGWYCRIDAEAGNAPEVRIHRLP